MPNSSVVPEEVATLDAFWHDIQAVLAVSEVAFDKLMRRVEKERDFLGRAELVALLSEELPDEAQRTALLNFTRSLPAWRQRTGKTPSDFARDFLSDLAAFESQRRQLTDEEHFRLNARVERIVTPNPGLDRQRKVESLLRNVAATLDSLTLFTDVRPMFDEDGAKIEGMVPTTVLRVGYTVGNNQIVADIRLTETDLADLLKKAERAKRKLAAVHEALSSFRVPSLRPTGSVLDPGTNLEDE
jgi:hypothetical protein